MPTSVKNRVLLLLSREWDLNGPPGIMDIGDIVAALPLAPGDILAALRDLYVAGLVDMNRLKTSAFLTPEGYEAVERETGKGEIPP